RAAHRDAEHDQTRRGGEVGFLVVDVFLRNRPAGAAMLLRPVRRDPALLVQGLVPVHDLVARTADALCHLLRDALGQLFLQEGANLLAEGVVFGPELEIHVSLRDTGMPATAILPELTCGVGWTQVHGRGSAVPGEREVGIW